MVESFVSLLLRKKNLFIQKIPESCKGAWSVTPKGERRFYFFFLILFTWGSWVTGWQDCDTAEHTLWQSPAQGGTSRCAFITGLYIGTVWSASFYPINTFIHFGSISELKPPQKASSTIKLQQSCCAMRPLRSDPSPVCLEKVKTLAAQTVFLCLGKKLRIWQGAFILIMSPF